MRTALAQRRQRLNHRPLVVREISPSHPACLPPRIQPGQQNVQTRDPNSVNAKECARTHTCLS